MKHIGNENSGPMGNNLRLPETRGSMFNMRNNTETDSRPRSSLNDPGLVLAAPKMVGRSKTKNTIILNKSQTKMVQNQDSANKPKRVRIVGTPEYMAPEMIKGQGLGKPAIDYWALGVILFEMVVGCTPFSGETPQELFEKIKENKPPWDMLEIGYEEDQVIKMTSQPLTYS